MSTDTGAGRSTAPAASARRATTLDWRTRILVAIGGAVLRAMSATWRMTVINRDATPRNGSPSTGVIYILWHGDMLPLLAAHRRRAAVIVSEHRDGEIIARVIRLFQLFAIRGSTSRGGARVLLEAAQLLRDGGDVAITPDGPRGPRHSFAPGALVLAHRASALVRPVGTCVDRAWRLRSWDAFCIPKPFARVVVVYGDGVPVNAPSARDAAGQVKHFTELLHSVSMEAERTLELRS